MFDALWPYGLQYIRLPCPSLYPRVCWNSCPLSWWWCLTHLLNSVVPFSSCPQSSPESESLPLSQLFAPCGQSIGVSASASVLWMNIQGWFPLGLTGLVFLQSRNFSSRIWKYQSLALSVLYGPTLTSVHGKTIALPIWIFVGKGMALLFIHWFV